MIKKSLKEYKPRCSVIDRMIGENLRIIRNCRKMSQLDLSKALNITYQQVQKYEAGTNRLSLASAYKLSQLLNISIDDLLMLNEKALPLVEDVELSGSMEDEESEEIW